MIFFLFNHSLKFKSDLKFDADVTLAFKITPLATGEVDSLSLIFVPVLPI